MKLLINVTTTYRIGFYYAVACTLSIPAMYKLPYPISPSLLLYTALNRPETAFQENERKLSGCQQFLVFATINQHGE